MLNVSAICKPSPFSLSVIQREIKFLHLQNNEKKKILDRNTVRFSFPGFLGVTHFYGAEDLTSLVVHQMLESASDSDQNH